VAGTEEAGRAVRFAHEVIGLFSKEARRRIAVTPAELRVVWWAGAYFFFVLGGYSILRPVREQFGVRAGLDTLPLLFLGTWVVMLLLNPLYGAVVSRVTRRRFVPWVYRFFMVHLAVLFALMLGLEGEPRVWLGRAFFIWVSVFNLWVVSVFWSFMADSFGSEAARRLYAWIAVGGTLGSIVGALVAWQGLPLIAAALQRSTSEVVPYLLLVSLLMLEAAVRCARRVMGLFDADPTLGGVGLDARRARLGGGAWDGLREVARSPYLLQICLYLLCYTVTGTLLYFLQAEIVAHHFTSAGARTQAFALIDLFTQTTTLFVQVVLTRRLIAVFGVGRTLAILPVVAAFAFLAIWIAPVFWVVVLAQGLRRAARYAVSKPAREVLFSVVPRSEKFKAKAVIDTFVYRTGDVVGGATRMLLRGLAAGLLPVVVVALPLTAVWAWLGLALGRGQVARIRRVPPPPSATLAPSSGAGPTPETSA